MVPMKKEIPTIEQEIDEIMGRLAKAPWGPSSECWKATGRSRGAQVVWTESADADHLSTSYTSGGVFTVEASQDLPAGLAELENHERLAD